MRHDGGEGAFLSHSHTISLFTHALSFTPFPSLTHSFSFGAGGPARRQYCSGCHAPAPTAPRPEHAVPSEGGAGKAGDEGAAVAGLRCSGAVAVLLQPLARVAGRGSLAPHLCGVGIPAHRLPIFGPWLFRDVAPSLQLVGLLSARAFRPSPGPCAGTGPRCGVDADRLS